MSKKSLMMLFLLLMMVCLGQQVCRWLIRCGVPWGGVHGLVAIDIAARGHYGLNRII